jgi:Tol biopolymer transport system component
VLDREPPASLSLRVSILAADAHAEEPKTGWSRRLAVGLVAAAVIAAVLVVLALAAHSRSSAPAPAKPPPTLGPATNGWLAAEDSDRGAIYLVRAGEKPRRVEVAGSAVVGAACPAWSPDGTRLLFGRVTGSSQTGNSAELVIVPVGSDGTAGAQKTIALDGFGFDAYLHPCGTWSPDGRWIALAGTGVVLVVDTQTGVIHRLPGLRPSDLEWRPGTGQLAIAGGDMVTPVAIYSTTTGELSRLGDVYAGAITWSPDGTTLAYTGGGTDPKQLWLVDADGTNQRLLVGDMGSAVHGIGPVWSPTGDRIAYQRVINGLGEAHEIVLVNVADGTQRTIAPPMDNGSKHRHWYPYAVWWSPDGTTLLYAAWSEDNRAHPDPQPRGWIAVPADRPGDATVLISGTGPPDVHDHQWVIQMWGRQPE